MDYFRLFFEWLFERFGVQHPRLSFLGVFVFACLVGCFVWWMVGYKYRRDHPQQVATLEATGSPTVSSSAEPVSVGRAIKTEKRNRTSEHRSVLRQGDNADEDTGQKQPPAPLPLRKPMAVQVTVVRGLMRQLSSQGHEEFWLSKLFLAMRGGLDGLPSPGDIDYPAVFRSMEKTGEIKVIEAVTRPTRDFWGGETYVQDIHIQIIRLETDH